MKSLKKLLNSSSAVVSAGAVVGASLATSAFAQEGAQNAAVEIAQSGNDTIVVTAQKRAESIQDVPLAVTAFGENDLEAIKAVDVSDIAVRTPNFTATQFNLGEPQYYIRGVGSTSDSAASDPTVPVFIDEVYIGRAAGSNFDFFDLERIEVLRGPQGTLYGRNTTGGAISVVTKKPSTEDPYLRLQGVAGNYDTYEGRVVGNMPLSDAAAVKAAVSYRTQDGFSTNLFTGDELGGRENISARLQGLFEPTDRASILISADYAKDDNGGNARVPFPLFDDEPTTPAFRAVYPEGTDIRVSPSNPDGFQDRELWGVMARGEVETDIGVVTSITSYREVELNWFEDLAAAPLLPRNDDRVLEESNQFSQELRLSSTAESEIQWVAGLYYFTENVDRNETFDVVFAPVPIAGGSTEFIQDAKNTSYAAFAQATIPITDALNFTGGVRYTYDEKEIRQIALDNETPPDGFPGVPLFPGQPYDISAEEDFDAVTGRASLEYTMPTGDLIYVSYSRGFKSGVFPSQNNILQNVGEALAPEKVNNYEIGVKTDSFNNRLRLNATAFYLDYADLQQFILDAGLNLVTFSVDAEVYGFEFESVARPVDWLELGGTLSILETEIQGSVVNNIDLDGNDLPRSPNVSFNAFAATTFDAPGGEVFIRGNYSWRDDFFHEATNLRETEIGSYGLFDARIAYRPDNANVEIAMWGKNLADAEYQTHVIPFLGNGFSLFGPPRTFGGSITVEF